MRRGSLHGYRGRQYHPRAELSITIAMLGEVGRTAMRRDTARPGDDIFVTGTLGDAALGWRILARKLKPRGNAKPRRKKISHRAISASATRLYPGLRLAALKPAPAAIDMSDGLMQDLGHILERSGVGADIDASRIPLSPAYRAVMGGDLVHALTGGEDYELIFCARPGLHESEAVAPVARRGAANRHVSFGAGA